MVENSTALHFPVPYSDGCSNDFCCPVLYILLTCNCCWDLCQIQIQIQIQRHNGTSPLQTSVNIILKWIMTTLKGISKQNCSLYYDHLIKQWQLAFWKCINCIYVDFQIKLCTTWFVFIWDVMNILRLYNFN